MKRKVKEMEREKDENTRRMKREKDAESERMKRNDAENERWQRQVQQMQQDLKQKELQVQQLQQDMKQKELQVQQLQRDNLKKDRVIQQVKKENVHYKQNNSIEGLWKDAFTTKFVLNKVQGTGSTCHIDQNRIPATAAVAPFRLFTPRLEPEILMKASNLLAAFNVVEKVGHEYHRRKTYGNEADVQGYVHAALMDAVTIVNGLRSEKEFLTARHEPSIFSNKPDHVVVGIGSLQVPILVVETKQPTKTTISNHVWGQVFDYHGIMRVGGHNNPFVVLSTFEQSWITWVTGNEHCGKIATASNCDERFKHTLEQIKKHFSSDGTPSPCELLKGLPLGQRKEGPLLQIYSNTKPRKKDGVTRELYMSQCYDSNRLVKMFVNVIACSLRNISGSASIVRNDQGYSLRDKHVLTLTKDNYCFETISRKVLTAFKSSNFDEQGKIQFHILDFLGVGRTSKAFLAVTSKGHECVLKMYVRKYDETKNYETLSADKFNDDAYNSTTTEQRMYKLIYDMDVPIITLFDHKCLVLPYFRPVHKNERVDALEDLRKVLATKFRVGQESATKYFKFQTDDQLWRHCGYIHKHNKKSLIVFDLAELEECKTEEEHDTYIRHHMETLERKIPTAPDSAAAPILFDT